MNEMSPIVATQTRANVPKKGLFSGTDTKNLQAIGRKIRSRRAALAQGWVERHRHLATVAEKVTGEFKDWSEYYRRYAIPMLTLLERGFRNAQEQFLYVYRDERLRFFNPAPSNNEAERAELAHALDADLQGLLAGTGLEADTELGAALSEVMRALHLPMIVGRSARALKVAMVGDCLMTEIRCFLVPALELEDIGVEPHHFYFSARLGKDLSTDEIEAAIEKTKFDLLALSFLTFEGLPLYTSLLNEAASGKAPDSQLNAKCDGLLTIIERYINAIRTKTNAPILLHGCSGLPLNRLRLYIPVLPAMSRQHALIAQRLSEGLALVADGIENVIFLDERALVAAMGVRAANRRLLPRTLTHNALFHPSAFGRILAQEYARVLRAYQILGGTKVLLVDFDNTLWKGVMADGPVEHDVEAQRLLKELKDAGILLVAVSKNDPNNIRWGEMALSEDDFVLHKISWDTKPQSVGEVAGQLDLDPRSFVLIDDNPVERELVVRTVQGVVALDSLDPETWLNLRMMLKFPSTRQTEEASRRTAMYREAALRRETTAVQVDYGSMMRSLDLRVGWRKAQTADLDRVHELVSRTNQFNTTTIRYSAVDIAKIMKASGQDLIVVTLADKFGKLGLVGTVIATTQGNVLTYESVVMSCRAMGFGLEQVLVRLPLNARPGVARAIGRYVKSERNNPCADLFSQSGFAQTGPETWELDVTQHRPEIPDWFTMEET